MVKEERAFVQGARDEVAALLAQMQSQPSDERKAAEHEYTCTAFDYPSAPVGSRDWTLFWKGWQAARALGPVKAQQEPVAVVKENPYCPEGMSDELSTYLPVGTPLYTEAHQGAQPAVPEGMRLVPVEPTPHMLFMAANVDGQSSTLSRAIYRAMIDAAAPSSAQPQESAYQPPKAHCGHCKQTVAWSACSSASEAEHCVVAQEPQGEAQQPTAWVPIHPRNGPLWAMTTSDPSPERLPSSYPLRPVYWAAQGEAQQPDWQATHGCTHECREGTRCQCDVELRKAQQQESRKPLTDERVREVLDGIDFKRMVTADDIFYLIFRAAEREHGIGTGASKEVNE
jgi:hypothetical protein